MERYNIFASLEEVKRMLKNQRFFVERNDLYLEHVESHISCDLDGGDLMDPPRSSARVLENISPSKNDQ